MENTLSHLILLKVLDSQEFKRMTSRLETLSVQYMQEDAIF